MALLGFALFKQRELASEASQDLDLLNKKMTNFLLARWLCDIPMFSIGQKTGFQVILSVSMEISHQM